MREDYRGCPDLYRTVLGQQHEISHNYFLAFPFQFVTHRDTVNVKIRFLCTLGRRSDRLLEVLKFHCIATRGKGTVLQWR
jgi:hypothetical protein